MLGAELMGVLYKGYSVPAVDGRYVDMGMSFKKNDDETKEHTLKTRKPKRKAGELMALVYEQTNRRWQRALDIHPKVDAAVESVRSALIKLHTKGMLECNNVPGKLKYRRLR